MEIPMVPILVIGVPIVFALSVAIFKYFSKIKKCLDKADKRSFRQSKALQVLANRIDDINAYQHPEKGKLNLGPEIETILKDDKGNF